MPRLVRPAAPQQGNQAMPAVACKECRKEIARNAWVCPHCGVLNPVVSAQEPLIELSVLAVIFAGAVVMCSDRLSLIEPVDLPGKHVNHGRNQ